MSKIQLVPNEGLVSFEINVNGKVLKDTYEVISIEVNNEVNKIPGATISLAVTSSDKSNPGLDDTLIPGNKIEIKLGYDQNEKGVFKGMITSQSIRSRDNDNYVLSLHCHDKVMAIILLDGGSPALELTNRNNIYDIEMTLTPDQRKVGRVEFPGSSMPKINSKISINGFGKHYDGDVPVTRIRHLVREGTWKTVVDFGLSPDVLQVEPQTATNDGSASILTKSGLKIELSDEEKKVTIATPKGNTCVISDKDSSILLKDEHGNTVEMNASGINLKSAKDITLDATGDIKLKANQKIDLKASGGDVSIAGLNITANGQVSATVKGGASAELSADGQTTVQGAMVMIN